MPRSMPSGAKPVDVDLLPEAEAARLLEGIVGAERVAAEPESAAAILRQCGHLPLAIRVAGAKLSVLVVAVGAVGLWMIGVASALGPALRGAQVPPAIATRNV